MERYQTLVRFERPISAIYATSSPDRVLEGKPVRDGIGLQVEEVIVSTILYQSLPNSFLHTEIFRAKNGDFFGILEKLSITDFMTGDETTVTDRRWASPLYLVKAHSRDDVPFIIGKKGSELPMQDSDIPSYLLNHHMKELFLITDTYRKHKPQFQTLETPFRE